MDKALDFKLEVKGSEDLKIWKNCGENTITIHAHLNIFYSLNDTKISLDLPNLINLLKSDEELLNYFLETSTKELIKISNKIVNLNNKETIKENSIINTGKDIYINFYNEKDCDFFTIAVLTEEGKTKVLSSWKEYIEDLISKK